MTYARHELTSKPLREAAKAMVFDMEQTGRYSNTNSVKQSGGMRLIITGPLRNADVTFP